MDLVQVDEGVIRRLLLRFLLGGAPGSAEAPAVDADTDLETLAVVRALLIEELIDRGRVHLLLRELLELRLEVALVFAGDGRLDMWQHVFQLPLGSLGS